MSIIDVKSEYKKLTLDTKIRYSYLLIIVPFTIFLIFCMAMLWSNNRRYTKMINSTVIASEFSLDFKKDFDYETYLLIVGNKSIDESKLDEMLVNATRIVDGLVNFTDDADNLNRLGSVEKYLVNLETYVNRIKKNLSDGNKYEENIEIWENDVQIVTSLVREDIFQYTFYEVKGIQEAREEYQDRFVKLISMVAVLFALVFAGVLYLSFYLSRTLTEPIRKIGEVTDQVTKGDLSVRSEVRDGVEVTALTDSLNAMIDKINQLLEQVTTEQIRLRKAEFELLQAQINPHFLYNTLDAIVWLAESGDQKKVVKMVGSLSEFFRTALNQGRDIIAIYDELQHVRSYLEIQHVRYEDILSFEIDMPEELYSGKIPKITIQPLVENALYHGIKLKRGMGKIVIKGEKSEDGDILIHVIDDGMGMQPERLKEITEALETKRHEEAKMYGVYNVDERIKLNFGEAYGLTVRSEYTKGTEVTIRLPFSETEE